MANICLFAQFYTELGTGYAFPTEKSKTIFDKNNFNKISNIYSGIFYKGLIGYKFKSNLAVELNCEFNPKATNILNSPKSFKTVSYSPSYYLRGPSFMDGSYISFIPKVSYNYIKNNFGVGVGLGIGYFLLNYYNYTYQNTGFQTYYNGNNLYYKEIEYGQELYRYTYEYYTANVDIKLSLALYKNINIFLGANANLLKIEHDVGCKYVYLKYHKEIFDIHSNPQTIITDIDEKNVKIGYRPFTPYENYDVFKASDISKLIFTQIGLRYNFGKTF